MPTSTAAEPPQKKALGSEAEVALECFTLWSDDLGDSLTFRQSSSLSAGTVEYRAGRAREYQRQNGGARCIRDRRRLWLCIVRRDRPVHCGLGRYVTRRHGTPCGAVATTFGLLATVNEQLQHITWTRGASAFATQPVGAAGCGPASFSVSNNGRCVLYVENTDGKVGQTYDEEGNPVAVMGKLSASSPAPWQAICLRSRS